MQENNQYRSVLLYLPQSVRRVLERVENNIQKSAQEIRLRSFSPLCLTVNGQTLFVSNNGQTFKAPNDPYVVTGLELNDTYYRLCEGSVYSHSGEIKEGYIFLKQGNRAGIAGAFTDDGNLKDISSVNIRIARQIFGAADALINKYTGGSVLIAGPPGSGKTTVLRDFIRSLSSGNAGKYYRVCAIDCRGELSAEYGGRVYNDLGPNTDVLLGVDKQTGLTMATRSLYPDIVAFDEVSTIKEVTQILNGFNAGVNVVTTAHISSIDDLLKRSVTRALLKSGVIKTVAILKPYTQGQMTVKSAERIMEQWLY